jgi:hypothetical protein
MPAVREQGHDARREPHAELRILHAVSGHSEAFFRVPITLV